MNSHLSRIFGKLHNSLWEETGLSFFLYLLFLSLFLAPFVDSLPARLLTSLCFSLFIFFGVINMSQQPTIRFFGGVIACVAVVLRWMRHIMPSPAILKFGSLATLVFMIMLTIMILMKVFGNKGPVTGHRIRGAIAVYLLFGIIWSVIYGLLDQILPNAFSLPAVTDEYSAGRQEVLTYFSFVTLTTLGYGEVLPTHEISRMFVIIEALCGQLYPATILARLVSLELTQKHGCSSVNGTSNSGRTSGEDKT